jgi:hypothetical protein
MCAVEHPPAPNPSLQDLQFLVGRWDVQISRASFLPSPQDTVDGRADFGWIEDGAFLVLHQGGPVPGPPSGRMVMGRDENTPDYMALYFDERGVSRLYSMHFAHGVWRLWRNTPDFSQRFEGLFDEGGDVISAHWEKSFDGDNWEHDFDITYTRHRPD